MPLPDLTTLTPEEQQTLLVQLLRLITQTSGTNAIHSALQASYTASTENTTNDEDELSESDIAAADEYLKNVRQRIEAKYGPTELPE